jgi:hypothetical protein
MEDEMATITLTCDTCNKEFEKVKGEYNRKIRQGKTKFYCGLKCSGRRPENVARMLEYEDNKWTPETCPANTLDEWSKFRPMLRKAKQRPKDFDLTLEHLKDVWDSQGGICPFTGFELEFRTYDGESDTPLNIKSASLDRIDNSKGYVKGNVRFVSVMFNFARNKFSDEEVIEFAQAVIENRG